MALTLAEKIIKQHLVSGKMAQGEEVTLELDHCLLQDATGTMAWLEYEAIGAKRVKPAFCIQYIDHNLLQEDNKNMDDHLFLQTIAPTFGALVSLPGNGISHHIHKERFTKPGQVMIGSDSHTPTSGGAGMLAIGTGGLEVAAGMATGTYTFSMPEIMNVQLTGRLKPWVTAKDVILEILRRIDVDGGKGKILEFSGDGVKHLTVAQRSTIANMGAETGATTSIFPADAQTKSFFLAEQRVKDYKALQADKGATYAVVIHIELDKLEPLIACPYSPGKVKHIREVAGIAVGQSMIGSSTNSSYESLMTAASMLTKKNLSPTTAFHLIPGSRQVLETIARDGGLLKLLHAGTRIAEPSCNACIGMGNAPATDIVSVRSFPRNWEGRSGTAEDQVFLASPEVAVAAAITGELVDPRDLKLAYPKIAQPKSFVIDDRMILKPPYRGGIKRGPNIKKIRYRVKLDNHITGRVLITLGDDISTDHIMPAGAKILPLRSNIPAISAYVFHYVDPTFIQRCKDWQGGIIVGGDNYGQGSSREHAALAPMHLGVKAVIAKSYARIHRENLINFGIVPLEFTKKGEYAKIKQGDVLEITGVKTATKTCGGIQVKNKTTGKQVDCSVCLTARERDIILKGGLLHYLKTKK